MNRMKYVPAFFFLFITSHIAFSQTPKWFTDQIKVMEGVWLADNSEYMNEQETDDTYGLEWKPGVGGTSLMGELFGLKDGKKTGSYWQFFQYYDEGEDAIIVIQVSPWGTSGRGKLIKNGDNKTKLDQVFSNSDGTSYRVGHTTEFFEGYEISISYDINSAGEWIKSRTYKWIKQ